MIARRIAAFATRIALLSRHWLPRRPLPTAAPHVYPRRYTEEES